MNRIEISFVEPMPVITNTPNEEIDLFESLGKRNHTAQRTLIDRFHSRLLQLTKMFVPNENEAEQVVQEMRVRILEEIQQDEGRSCLEILIFQILTKERKTYEVQESWGTSRHAYSTINLQRRVQP